LEPETGPCGGLGATVVAIVIRWWITKRPKVAFGPPKPPATAPSATSTLIVIRWWITKGPKVAFGPFTPPATAPERWLTVPPRKAAGHSGTALMLRWRWMS
jgi:hypothetical protein